MSPEPQPVKNGDREPGTIKLVSHSMLLYWWPVWACGFLFGVLSLVQGYRLAIVPEGTRLRAGPEGPEGKTYELVVPDKPGDRLGELAGHPKRAPFTVPMSPDKNFGLLYCFILLVVIFATNVPLRGLWSVVVVLLLALLAGALAALDLWESIVETLGHLHIYITAAGYLFLSGVLFVLWLVTVFAFDPRRYIIFTPGQLVVHQEVGDMRQVFDTTNVVVEKRRSDFFRNVMLGIFTGDVLVKVQGGQGPTFVLPNVMFAAWKVQQVSNLMKTRPIIAEA